MLRAGLTEVLVTGIEIRWMGVSASPMARAAKPLRRAGRGGAEDHRDEEEGADHLADEAESSEYFPGLKRAVAVGGEAAGDEAGLAARDQVEGGGGEDCARELGDE